MSRRSSTSSSKLIRVAKPAWIALFAAVLFFAGDRLLFRLFFPLYDQIHRIGSIGSEQILIVGSSHVAFAVDDRELARLTRRKVTMVSMPGTNLLLRYQVIKSRLEGPAPPPEVVVLETSRHVFDPEAYSDHAAIPLLAPYFHRGYFADFMSVEAPKSAGWRWRSLSQLSSLNSAFSPMFDPRNFARFLLDLSGEKIYDLVKMSVRSVPLLGASCDAKSPEAAAEVARWKVRRGKFSEVHAGDSRLQDLLRDIAELSARKGVRLVLLDVPYFSFPGDVRDPAELRARDFLRGLAAKAPRTTYIALDIPNDVCLFRDSVHLSLQGQVLFTKQFADWLVSLRLSSQSAIDTPLDQI